MRGIDRGLGGLDLGLVIIVGALGDIQILGRSNTAGAQLLLTFQSNLVEHELGLGLSELAFGLLQRRLIRARINSEEQIPFFHIGAVLEIARDDLTTDLRLNFDTFDGSAGADLI